jgi:hypothetical protein
VARLARIAAIVVAGGVLVAALILMFGAFAIPFLEARP